MNKLARMLCIEFHQDVTQGIITLIDKRDEENVDFDEFLNAIQPVLTFENFFDELDGLFRHLDYQKQGKIKIRDLVDSCAKLTSSEIAGTHEIRVPSATDIE